MFLLFAGDVCQICLYLVFCEGWLAGYMAGHLASVKMILLLGHLQYLPGYAGVGNGHDDGGDDHDDDQHVQLEHLPVDPLIYVGNAQKVKPIKFVANLFVNLEENCKS